jgi:hypothetical protein
MRRLFSEESDSFWTKESCPQGAVLVDKEFQRYRVYRIDEEAVMPEQYYKEYDGYWKQWETIDWSIDWVSGEADGLGLSNQNIQRGIEVLFALYRPRFTYYANAETQESAVQLREMKAAYTDFIKSKEAGVRRFEKYGDMTPSIAVLNICGDSLPELVTITIEEDWWHLSVWSYENGAICLLEDEALSVTWGGSGVGVAKMTDGRLLVFSESYDEGFGSSMLRIFELINGRFVKTMELEYAEGYSEEGRIEGFWNNGVEINESAYKNEWENMLAAIELPLIANPRDENYEVLNHFIGSKAMTYDEAIAFLSR